MSQILIVDDEPAICWALRSALEEEQHQVQTAGSAEEAFLLMKSFTPEVILLDVRLPGQDGLSAMETILQQNQDLPVIIMTAFGNLQTAVTAIQGGAFEYLTKPFDLDQALDVVSRSLSKPKLAAAAEQSDEGDSFLMLGSSAVIQEVYRQIAFAASHELPVLLTGEKGTGKSLVAKTIHHYSSRTTAPFYPLNISLLKKSQHSAESLFQSALVCASQGTLFFEGIEQLTAEQQCAVLHLLDAPLDARIIASAGHELPQLLSSGAFEHDLYERLNLVSIELPPLRTHREDIPKLASHFLKQLKLSTEVQLTESAVNELHNRHWSGNLRELRNVIEQTAVRSRNGLITADDLPDESSLQYQKIELAEQIRETLSRWMQLVAMQSGSIENTGYLYEKFQADFESQLMPMVLQQTDGNKQEAAALLGIHRQTLREKLKRFGINQS